MNNKMNGILKIFLFKESFYKKVFQNKYLTLFGIIIVGIIDFLSKLIEIFQNIKIRPSYLIAVNIAVFVIFVVLVGLFDVIAFSLPLRDFFRYIKIKTDKEQQVITSGSSNTMVEYQNVVNVYILAHFFVMPLEYLMHFLEKSNEHNYIVLPFLVLLWFLIEIWFYVIVARGIKIMFNLSSNFSIMIFISAYFWGMIEGFVLTNIVNIFILPLFVAAL